MPAGLVVCASQLIGCKLLARVGKTASPRASFLFASPCAGIGEHCARDKHITTCSGGVSVDCEARGKLPMQPLPLTALQATKLLGCNGTMCFRAPEKKVYGKGGPVDRLDPHRQVVAGSRGRRSCCSISCNQGAKWRPNKTNDLDLFGTPAALRTAKRLFWKPDADVVLGAEYDALGNRCKQGC